MLSNYHISNYIQELKERLKKIKQKIESVQSAQEEEKKSLQYFKQTGRQEFFENLLTNSQDEVSSTDNQYFALLEDKQVYNFLSSKYTQELKSFLKEDYLLRSLYEIYKL